MTGTPDEKIADWLERLDIPVENTTSITALQSYLRDQFPSYTDAQINALTEAQGLETNFQEAGIRAIVVEYPWGKELRYGIQGLSGLWGYEAAQSVYEETVS